MQHELSVIWDKKFIFLVEIGLSDCTSALVRQVNYPQKCKAIKTNTLELKNDSKKMNTFNNLPGVRLLEDMFKFEKLPNNRKKLWVYNN